MKCFAARADAKTVPLFPVTKDTLKAWLKKSRKATADWVSASGYKAAPGKVLLLPGGGKSGGRPLDGALVGVEGPADIWSWGGAASTLPKGRYAVADETETEQGTRAALGWALGSYQFDAYKETTPTEAVLVWPKGVDRRRTTAIAEGIYLCRDLINTPASDMGPGELAEAARTLARAHKGKVRMTVGDDLLRENYPMIHAVGRASARAPRLIDLSWGRARAPKVTLVGKGVCFDTGGLDLKSDAGMKLMKKDMGGAAQVLGLASMIMATGLGVRLRVLIPAVENSVSGDAMRPLDVLSTRKGLTVEVGNTDAEGRLVLADALTAAVEEQPELILDFATLTGAARVAVGTDMAAMFSSDETLATDMLDHAEGQSDPVWRLPLWKPYRRMLESNTADMNNIGNAPYGGAITAALFLNEFVPDDVPWAHFDLMAWNTTNRPGRPQGGEAQGIRAAFAMLAERYG